MLLPGGVNVTVKKRLIISNVLVIMLSIVFILLVFFVSFLAFFGVLGITVRDIEQRDGVANNLQTFTVHRIDNYCREDDPQERAELAQQLRDRVDSFGFTSRFYCDGVLIYDALDEAGSRMLAESTALLGSGRAVAAETDSAAIVHYDTTVRGLHVQFDAIRIYDAYESEAGTAVDSSEVSRYVEIYTLLILVCAVIAIFISSVFISTKTSHSITKPLDLLRKGSQEIKNGNLDYKIYYRGKGDEFEHVCSDFDDMRLRLKNSVQLQMDTERQRKQLYAGISHDLRTPLTAIKGYVEGLRDGVASTPEMREKYLRTIYQKACDMDKLVDRLLLFTRLDSGQYPFKFEAIHFKKYLDRFLAQRREDYLALGLEIQYEDQLAGDEIVRMDVQEFNRVLANILDNSVKYKADSAGLSLVTACTAGDRLILSLQDNGCGVDQADLNDIFTDFFRTDRARKNTGSGSGLGLAISRHIITAHQGRIYAESENGLKIIIDLPFEREQIRSEANDEEDSDH